MCIRHRTNLRSTQPSRSKWSPYSVVSLKGVLSNSARRSTLGLHWKSCWPQRRWISSNRLSEQRLIGDKMLRWRLFCNWILQKTSKRRLFNEQRIFWLSNQLRMSSAISKNLSAFRAISTLLFWIRRWPQRLKIEGCPIWKWLLSTIQTLATRLAAACTRRSTQPITWSA